MFAARVICQRQGHGYRTVWRYEK